MNELIERALRCLTGGCEAKRCCALCCAENDAECRCRLKRGIHRALNLLDTPEGVTPEAVAEAVVELRRAVRPHGR